MLLRSLRRFGSEAGARWPWLILELAIVVVGVSLSFLLQDWREQRAVRLEERSILINLRDDLRGDSGQLEHWDKLLADMIDCHQVLLQAERRATTERAELDRVMDQFLSYVTFTPGDNTWRALDPRRNLAGDAHRDLLVGLRQLYGTGHALANEWGQINAEFVRGRAIPFVDANAPFVPPPEDPLGLTGLGATVARLAEMDAFLNLVRTSRSYRAAQRVVLQRVAEKTQALIAELDAALGTTTVD